MTSPPATDRMITIGVDSHKDAHVAAAVDQLGRILATTSIPTTPQGFVQLERWASRLGQVDRATHRAQLGLQLGDAPLGRGQLGVDPVGTWNDLTVEIYVFCVFLLILRILPKLLFTPSGRFLQYAVVSVGLVTGMPEDERGVAAAGGWPHGSRRQGMLPARYWEGGNRCRGRHRRRERPALAMDGGMSQFRNGVPAVRPGWAEPGGEQACLSPAPAHEPCH
jgi:hypothetical protein